MSKTLEIIKENSLLTEGIQSGDIAQTDEIVSAIISQKYIDSLAYQICDIQPIHGPTGSTFAIKYDGVKTKVVKNPVVVEDDAIQDTGFTLEAIQDIQNQFGKGAVDFISRAFAGVASSAENTKLLAKLDSVAFDAGTLTLTNAKNAETVFFETAKKVSESIIKINSKHYRTMDAFVVLPITAASALMGLGVYFNDDEGDGAGLFLGKIKRTKYYINPDITSTTAYVGLNGTMPGTSSLIFSPYQHQVITAVDADSGEKKVFNVNRYAITENALSEATDEMIHKFDIV